ncbi:MAG: hypothetical protein LUG98_09590, partial [Tannerellaceae bacterium]|nr:hypothetical protein [Tannerellaceae bacterium]
MFLLNFLLAYQLEMTLKKEVKERVSVATDGFYLLTFENLSIHLLNGELKIEGIRLIPDSLVFAQWQAKDSLPLTYLEASIQKIDFKGINLIWLSNYRKLNFRTFEIANPVIHVIDAFYSDRHIHKVPEQRSKTLYEFIEPYIDVLSVDRLNVENAFFSFLVESPFTPILYRIDDIDLYTYNFRLDSSSYANGKLLYSDHFEFISDRPQTIISNNQFQLVTDTILVNTQDSLLYLKDIRLLQNKESDNQSGYIEGMISSVRMNGAAFKREDAFNSLYAETFYIDSSDIHIFQEASDSKQDSTQEKNGLTSLSLYHLITPVLKKVDIKTIDIQESGFSYSTLTEEPDSVSIRKIELKAHHFLIDSVYEKKHGLWYSPDIYLKAEDIYGHLPSQNQSFQMDSLQIGTEEGNLYIKNARFKPVSNRQTPYIDGELKGGEITGLRYGNGISLEHLFLENPNLHIQQASGPKKKKSSGSFPETFQFLAIEDLLINQGTVRITRGNTTICRLNGFGAHAKELYLDINNMKRPGQTGISYRTFDLNLPHGNHFVLLDNYRFQVKQTSYSSESGILDIGNVAIHSMEQEASGNIDPALQITIPQARITGLEEIGNQTENIKLHTVSIQDPSVKIRKYSTNSSDSIQQKTEEYTPFQPFRTLEIDHIALAGTHIDYKDQTNQTELEVEYEQLNIGNIQWNLVDHRTLSIGNFEVFSPNVGWRTESYDTLAANPDQTKTIPEILYPYTDKLALNHLYAENILLNAGQPYLKAEMDIHQVYLDSLNWFFSENDKALYTNRIAIIEPDIQIHKEPVPAGRTEKQKTDSIKTSLYDQLKILGSEIRIDDIELTAGEIYFQQTFTEDSSFSQKINKTDFRLTELAIDNEQESIQYGDIHLLTRNFSYPIDNGFYTVETEQLEIKNRNVEVTNFHMNPRYDKTHFAYLHPKHADWFDVTFDRLYIQDFDFLRYFSDSLL